MDMVIVGYCKPIYHIDYGIIYTPTLTRICMYMCDYAYMSVRACVCE